MAHRAPNECPHCGKPLEQPESTAAEPAGKKAGTAIADQPREYDHRGIALPRRTRVGGIITPQ
jgi:hypothetical protein